MEEEKVTPHFSEVFKGPFTADEQCCYIWCNDGAQVCFDVMDERDAALGKRIADCLNDVPDKKTFYDIGVSKDGQYICDGHSPILCVRGWGHLTGTGGLNLTGEQAREIQDEFVRWAAEQFGGATVATADMLTAEKIKWSLSASVGRKFSQQFALNKQAQRVDYNPNQETADPEPETPSGGGNGGGGNTPGGELEG